MRVDMSRLLSRGRRRSAVLTLAPLTFVLLTASPVLAQREDQGLQLGCANDYFRLCAGVDPNSSDAEKCMDRNRSRLSPECRAAIGDYDRRTGGKASKRNQGADD